MPALAADERAKWLTLDDLADGGEYGPDAFDIRDGHSRDVSPLVEEVRHDSVQLLQLVGDGALEVGGELVLVGLGAHPKGQPGRDDLAQDEVAPEVDGDIRGLLARVVLLAMDSPVTG
jgi:hypothetical protein